MKRWESHIVLALLAVLLSTPALAGSFTLGEVNVENPRIIATYTKDVRLDLDNSLLRNTDSGEEYNLTGSPAGYATTFTLFTDRNLTAGNHVLVLASQDKRTGLSSVDTASFTVSGMEIRLLSPRFGIAAQRPYTVRFETRHTGGQAAPSTCSYNLLGWDRQLTLISGASHEHQITGLSHNGYLYISCQEDGGRTTRKRFVVGWDSTPPVVNASVIPNPVFDTRDKTASLVIRTDENATCEVEGEPLGDPGSIASYKLLQEHPLYYNDIVDTAEHRFTYEVSCTNLAGLSGSSEADAVVNFGIIPTIDVLSPAQLINRGAFNLTVRPTFVATVCTANGAAMQQSGGLFMLPYSTLQDGVLAFNISCRGQRSAAVSYNVTVDMKGPLLEELNITDATCDGSIGASYRATDSGSGVLSYTFNVSVGPFTDRTTTIRTTVSLRIPKTVSGDIEWTVFATDMAGNAGAPKTVTAACTSAPLGNGTQPNSTGDLCTNGMKDIGEQDVDCGGSCASCTTCSSSIDCLSGFTCSLAGNCVPLSGAPITGGCASDLDCLGTEVCDAGLCVPAPVNGCTLDSQCEPHERCDTLLELCVPKDDEESACATADDCLFGQDCRAGACVDITDDTDDALPPPDEGANWLAIVLVAAGLLIMGGAGYYLYMENEQKKQPIISSTPVAQAKPVPPVTPPSATRAVPIQRPQQQARQQEMRQQKDTKRRAVFDAFTGKAAQEKPQAQPKQPAPKKPSKAKDDDEVFDELDKLGK